MVFNDATTRWMIKRNGDYFRHFLVEHDQQNLLSLLKMLTANTACEMLSLFERMSLITAALRDSCKEKKKSHLNVCIVTFYLLFC